MATVKKCDVCGKEIKTRVIDIVLNSKKEVCEVCYSKLIKYVESLSNNKPNILGELGTALKKFKDLP